MPIIIMARCTMRLLAALAAVAPAFAANNREDLTKYVLPKVGTEGAIPGVSSIPLSRLGC